MGFSFHNAKTQLTVLGISRETFQACIVTVLFKGNLNGLAIVYFLGCAYQYLLEWATQ